MTENLTKREKKLHIKKSMIELQQIFEEYKIIAAEIKDLKTFKRLKNINEEISHIIKSYEDDMIF